MNLRIISVFLFILLLASVEVQARILQERSQNSMAETTYGFSSASSALKNSELKLLLMIIKKPILLQTATLSSFRPAAGATENSSWKKFENFPLEKEKITPPSPRVSPPEHLYGASALPYESPPNPFLASS